MTSSDLRLLRDLPGSTIDMSVVHRPERERAFSYALGQMIVNFSNVEVATVYLLASVTGVRQGVLKAVIYPLRIDNAVSVIKRVMSASKMTGKAATEIRETLDQLLKINKLRNDLLHLGTIPSSDDISFRITNKHIAFHSSILRSTDINISTIRKADHDLVIILYLWFYFISARNKRLKVFKEHSTKRRRRTFAFDIDVEAKKFAIYIRDSIPLGSKLSWLYKPRPPKGSTNKTRRKRQSPASQPQSS